MRCLIIAKTVTTFGRKHIKKTKLDFAIGTLPNGLVRHQSTILGNIRSQPNAAKKWGDVNFRGDVNFKWRNFLWDVTRYTVV